MIWGFKQKQDVNDLVTKNQTDLSTQSFDLLHAIDAESIVVGVLSQLVREKKINKKVIQAAIDKYKLDDVSAADPGNTEGSG